MEYYCDVMRHLVCKPYSVENLHKMARELGIKRCWFHKDHYDIPKRRIDEIQAKCTLVSPVETLRIIGRLNKMKQMSKKIRCCETCKKYDPGYATIDGVRRTIIEWAFKYATDVDPCWCFQKDVKTCACEGWKSKNK